jgi:hypothetical protein
MGNQHRLLVFPSVAYEIQFVSSTKRQLRGLAANERVGVVDAIEQQLSDEPEVETNRKRLRQNPIALWETSYQECTGVL